MLYAVKATEVRPSGGVYFVPVQYESDVQAMRNLLRALKQEFFAVPLVDSADSRDMVGVKFREQIGEVIARFAEVMRTGAASKGELVNILNRTRDLLASVEEYQKLLQEDMQDLLSRVEIVKAQARMALERLAVA
jgi:ATP-dependent protease Clp ATPase subunit